MINIIEEILLYLYTLYKYMSLDDDLMGYLFSPGWGNLGIRQMVVTNGWKEQLSLGRAPNIYYECQENCFNTILQISSKNLTVSERSEKW